MKRPPAAAAARTASPTATSGRADPPSLPPTPLAGGVSADGVGLTAAAAAVGVGTPLAGGVLADGVGLTAAAAAVGVGLLAAAVGVGLPAAAVGVEVWVPALSTLTRLVVPLSRSWTKMS